MSHRAARKSFGLLIVVAATALFTGTPAVHADDGSPHFTEPGNSDEFQISTPVQFKIKGPPNGQYSITMIGPGSGLVFGLTNITLDANGEATYPQSFGNLGEHVIQLREGHLANLPNVPDPPPAV